MEGYNQVTPTEHIADTRFHGLSMSKNKKRPAPRRSLQFPLSPSKPLSSVHQTPSVSQPLGPNHLDKRPIARLFLAKRVTWPCPEVQLLAQELAAYDREFETAKIWVGKQVWVDIRGCVWFREEEEFFASQRVGWMVTGFGDVPCAKMG